MGEICPRRRRDSDHVVPLWKMDEHAIIWWAFPHTLFVLKLEYVLDKVWVKHQDYNLDTPSASKYSSFDNKPDN
jgi:hypothetical protein